MSEPGTANVYSTGDVHPRDRVSYWVEVATKKFYRHEFRSKVGPSFFGELGSSIVGQLWVGRCKCDPCDIGHKPRDIARDDVDDILISVRLSGTTLVAQGDREAVNEAGTMTLLDARRPSRILFQSPTDFVVVRVPREPLAARLGDLGEVTARRISIERPIAGIAAGFLSMLADRAALLDGAVGAKLCEQALDLVALAVSNEIGSDRVTLSSPRCAALMRLKSAIEARLCEHALRPAAVAAAAGISVRYANDLLFQEGFSIERYVLHQRLERCRQALENPAQSHRMISEIAYAWGFSDLSHFGRRFRAAYGTAPSDYRRRAVDLSVSRKNHEDVAAAQQGTAPPGRSMRGGDVAP